MGDDIAVCDVQHYWTENGSNPEMSWFSG